MKSSVAPLLHRRSHLPTRTYRSLLHLCSSFDREPRLSLATPAVLQELVLRSEIGQVSLGNACESGEVCLDENPSKNLSMLGSKPDGGSDESKAEKVETISQEKSLMLGDVFDGIDLQDSSVGSQHKDFFDDFELMMNESEDLIPVSCANLFEALDVNDYDHDNMVASLDDIAKPHDLQNIEEKLNIADEVQVDQVEGDTKVSENVGCKADDVPKLVETSEVISSGTLDTEMELGKPVSSTQVLEDSGSRIVEDKDVEEGEISGDDNDGMLVGDDLPVKSHEESHVSQEGTGNSHHTSHKSFGSSHFCGVGSLSTPENVDEKEQRHIGKKLGVEVSNVDNRARKSDETFNNEAKMDLGTTTKKKSGPSKEAKARKKAKFRKKRAQERISLGVKKLKLKPVAPKPKPIKYCRHYLKGRCHEGEKCKFSHDTIPETKSSPCCYFATQSCMKGDDCPYDHDLSKYPCNNFITKGFCHRGDNCLFSHKVTPDTVNAHLTSSTNTTATTSFSPQKSNKQTVRDAIAKLPAIQTRVSSPFAFLKPSSQSDSSSPKIDEHVTLPQIPPLRKPSVAPRGMSFLSLDKVSQEDVVKPSLGSKQNKHNSGDKTLKQSQQRSFLPLVPLSGFNSISYASEECKALNGEPEEAASSRNLKTRLNSIHIQSSLNSAMKLAAELESVKVEKRNDDSTEAVNKSDVAVNTSVTRNSGNISSKIFEFLSSFSHSKN